MLGQPLYFSPSWNRVSFSRKSTAGCPRQVLRSAHQHLHTAWGAISHPPPPPVIEPSQMTGTASECQNCYPPKDEILVNENLVYFFTLLFTPKRWNKKFWGKHSFGRDYGWRLRSRWNWWQRVTERADQKESKKAKAHEGREQLERKRSLWAWRRTKSRMLYVDWQTVFYF